MLNTSERVTVRQAVVRLRARDVAEALALLRSVLDAPRRRRGRPYDYPRLPGLVLEEVIVRDCPLGCPVKAVVCVARQIQSDIETGGTQTQRRCQRRADPDRPAELARHDGKRGTLASRPTCVTSHCALGASVRALVGDTPEAVEMAKRAPRCTDTSET